MNLDLLFFGLVIIAMASFFTFLISEVLENRFRNKHEI